MARIRTIKPEFFRHEALYEAEVSSGLPLRVAFAGMFTVADREGRFKWHPRVLKLDVMPFDEVNFADVLEALVTHGFLVKYQVGADMFGHIPNFLKHQHVNQRELDSVIPAPDSDGARTCENIPARGELERELEREGKGKLSLRSSDAHERKLDLEVEFSETFWPEFPHKVGKPAALKSFCAARKRADLRRIMDGLRRYVEAKPAGRDWLNPATFLNQDRFDDQPASPPISAKPKPHDTIFRALATVARQGDGGRERNPDPDGRGEGNG
jgi:hypothetical protein